MGLSRTDGNEEALLWGRPLACGRRPRRPSPDRQKPSNLPVFNEVGTRPGRGLYNRPACEEGIEKTPVLISSLTASALTLAREAWDISRYATGLAPAPL